MPVINVNQVRIAAFSKPQVCHTRCFIATSGLLYTAPGVVGSAHSSSPDMPVHMKATHMATQASPHAPQRERYAGPVPPPLASALHVHADSMLGTGRCCQPKENSCGVLGHSQVWESIRVLPAKGELL